MIPTTHLRTLRTSLRAYPPIFTSSTVSTPRRHIPSCLQTPHASPRAAAFFATTSPGRAAQIVARSRAPAREPELEPEPEEDEQEEPEDFTQRYPLNPEAANPPATTRPPPLNLPTRQPDQGTFSFYFATGKAYLTFYKTGLKHIYTNWQLVLALDPKALDTRSTFLLRNRQSHDIRRLAPFALFLLICGEFTPLVIAFFPALAPLTCRIPQQTAALRRKATARRNASFARLARVVAETKRLEDAFLAAAAHEKKKKGLEALRKQRYVATTAPAVILHVARAHGLISPLWDRVPDRVALALVARRAVKARVDLLTQDDFLLVAAGGAGAIRGLEELELACAMRGLLDVRGDRLAGAVLPDAQEFVLRQRLEGWQKSTPRNRTRHRLMMPGPKWCNERYLYRMANELDDGTCRFQRPLISICAAREICHL